MKKSLLTLILCTVVMGIGYAQFTDGIIAQPTHVVGMRINASGEVTATLESNFTYYENGKPRTFAIPDYALSTTYKYEGDYFIRESSSHDAGHPQLHEDLMYTYEGDKVKTIEHCWSHGYDYPDYWEYTYGEDGRLARKDYMNGIPGLDEFYEHYLYEYEDGGKTKIQNYWTSWPTEGMRLRQTTIYQYDDEYLLLTKHTENYNANGELTNSTLDTYSYTASGKQETQITQTLTEDEWVNTSIMRYVYDDNEQVVEQQNGSWSTENGEWNINRRVVFELSDDGTTYTVSFYKKNGEDWVWDVFNNQTIFFGSALANQQRTMRFYQKEEYNGLGNINQFEITLFYTEEPIYWDLDDSSLDKCNVYPNPGRDILRVVAPTEDAVIRLYNLQGQRVMARPFDFSTEINAEALPSGMYLWEIWHNSQKEACGKWVKE